MGTADGNDRVTVAISLNAADVKAFSRYIATGPEMAIFHRNRRFYLACCGAGAVALGLVITNWWPIVLLWAIGAVGVALYRSSAKARVALMRSSFACDLVADVSGLTATRTGTVSHIDWSAVEDLAVTATHVFARVSALTGYVIPKRCLHDPGDVDRIIRWRVDAKAGTAPI
jgi:hypothetical protein